MKNEYNIFVDDMQMRVIYTDGACKKNGIGGWGVFYEDDVEIIEIYGGCSKTTNNRMELQAVIEAICLKNDLDDCVIYTDSKYVQNGILSWIQKWKTNGWKTSTNRDVLNKDLWMKLDSIMDSRIKIEWVKGHDGNQGNERADHLANRGCSLLL